MTLEKSEYRKKGQFTIVFLFFYFKKCTSNLIFNTNLESLTADKNCMVLQAGCEVNYKCNKKNFNTLCFGSVGSIHLLLLLWECGIKRKKNLNRRKELSESEEGKKWIKKIIKTRKKWEELLVKCFCKKSFFCLPTLYYNFT